PFELVNGLQSFVQVLAALHTEARVVVPELYLRDAGFISVLGRNADTAVDIHVSRGGGRGDAECGKNACPKGVNGHIFSSIVLIGTDLEPPLRSAGEHPRQAK